MTAHGMFLQSSSSNCSSAVRIEDHCSSSGGRPTDQLATGSRPAAGSFALSGHSPRTSAEVSNFAERLRQQPTRDCSRMVGSDETHDWRRIGLIEFRSKKVAREDELLAFAQAHRLLVDVCGFSAPTNSTIHSVSSIPDDGKSSSSSG